MSPLKPIDLDELARKFGENLELVSFANMAARQPLSDFEEVPNFSRALVLGIEVQAQSSLILEWIEDHDIHNRERFSALAKRAKKLVMGFWANFQLVNVHTVNGNLKLAIPVNPARQQTVQDAPRKTYAKLPEKSKNVTGRGKGNRVDPDIVREIKKVIRDHYNGKITTRDAKEIGRAYNVDFKVVQNMYYGYSYAHIEID